MEGWELWALLGVTVAVLIVCAIVLALVVSTYGDPD